MPEHVENTMNQPDMLPTLDWYEGLPKVELHLHLDGALPLPNTYSGPRAMEADQRDGLYAGIADLIEQRYGGQVTKDYLAVLYLARKM